MHCPTAGPTPTLPLKGRGSYPFDRAHRVGLAQCGNDRMKVSEVVHLDVEMEGVEIAVAVDELKIDDVGVLLPKDARHGSQRSGNVAQDHAQPGGAAVRALAPGEVEPVGVDPAGERVAADHVNLDLLVLAPEADDAVAGNRMAAGRQMVGDAGRQALDRERLALAERPWADVPAD